MRILTYTVTEADAGRAVRSVVPRRFCLGQHAFRRLKVLGAIRIGDAPVRADYRLHAGEVIEVHLPSDMAQQSAAHEAAVPGLPPSFLRYQDEDLLIVSKGAPLPTLPARHIATGTLREQVMAMLHADPETFVYHPVNRLDKGTSGLLCIARHAHAQRLLGDAALLKELPERLVDARIRRQQRRGGLQPHPGAGLCKGVFLRLVEIKDRVVCVAQQHVVSGCHIVCSFSSPASKRRRPSF